MPRAGKVPVSPESEHDSRNNPTWSLYLLVEGRQDTLIPFEKNTIIKFILQRPEHLSSFEPVTSPKDADPQDISIRGNAAGEGKRGPPGQGKQKVWGWIHSSFHRGTVQQPFQVVALPPTLPRCARFSLVRPTAVSDGPKGPSEARTENTVVAPIGQPPVPFDKPLVRFHVSLPPDSPSSMCPPRSSWSSTPPTRVPN